jgi:hypothetical protein
MIRLNGLLVALLDCSGSIAIVFEEGDVAQGLVKQTLAVADVSVQSWIAGFEGSCRW